MNTSLGWWVLWAVLVLAGCQRPSAPELLVVSAVVPSEIQLGGGARIVGEGFVLGRPANVTLRGRLYRPGQPARELELRLPGHVESEEELVFSVPRDLQATLCGEPEEANHASFRGDVEVAIASRRPGMPPVLGTLRGATLELYPLSKTEAAEARSLAAGRRMLEFLGVEIAPSSSGLRVVRVDPTGRAARAGLTVGDRIASAAGGVTVLEPSDLVSEPARSLELVVARGHHERVVRVDTDGFAPVPPPALSRALALVGAVALVFAVLGSPLGALLARWETGLAEAWLGLRRELERRPAHVAGQGAPTRAAWLVLMGLAALVLAPLAGWTRFEPLPWLLGVWIFGRMVMMTRALLHGGRRRSERWSLRAGARAALGELGVSLPGLVAVAVALSEPGLSSARVVSRQGAWPWQWNAFASVSLLGLAVVFVLTSLPRPLARGVALRAGGCRSVPDRSGSSLVDWLQLGATAALGSVVWLGADRLSDGVLRALGVGPFAKVVAALYVLLKIGALIACVRLLRLGFAPLTSEHWSRAAWRAGVPLALALGALEHVRQSFELSNPLARWLAATLAPMVLLAAVALLALAVLRIGRGWARRQVASPVSPWL